MIDSKFMFRSSCCEYMGFVKIVEFDDEQIKVGGRGVFCSNTVKYMVLFN